MTIDTSKFIFIAGPCVVESYDMLAETASELKRIVSEIDATLIFKSSYRKANRTDSASFTGIGDEKALEALADIKEKFHLPITTDVHETTEIERAAEVADVLQIPAFLSRQTDLLVAAAKTGKYVNIKKGQFMSAKAAKKAAEKALKVTEKEKIWLTERGTFFGYGDLVVDFRASVEMRSFGFKTIFDATHSTQKPSIGDESGGAPEFAPALARAAAAVGVDGMFFETHPDPKNAKSDAATQLPLTQAKEFVKAVFETANFTKNLSNRSGIV